MKPIIMISSYPPRLCGIGTFCEEAREFIQKRNPDRDVLVISHTDGAGEGVFPLIDMSRRDWWKAVAEKVSDLKPYAVHIEHEYGLYEYYDDRGKEMAMKVFWISWTLLMIGLSWSNLTRSTAECGISRPTLFTRCASGPILSYSSVTTRSGVSIGVSPVEAGKHLSTSWWFLMGLGRTDVGVLKTSPDFVPRSVSTRYPTSVIIWWVLWAGFSPTSVGIF